MKIISFITDFPTISKILLHLKVWERSPPDRAGMEAANDPDQHSDLIYKPFDDGWPGYKGRLLQLGNYGVGAVCAISPLSVRPTGTDIMHLDKGA